MKKIEAEPGRLPQCENCQYAEWDYEDGYYGTNAKQWYIIGCNCDEKPYIEIENRTLKPYIEIENRTLKPYIDKKTVHCDQFSWRLEEPSE